MASEISQMSDSSIVIIQGTVGLYTVATRLTAATAQTRPPEEYLWQVWKGVLCGGD